LSPAARLVVFDIIAVHGLAARTFDGLRQAEVPPITVAAVSRVPIAASSNFWYQKKARPHFASRPLLNRGNRRNIAVSSLKREQIHADQGIKCTEIFQNYCVTGAASDSLAWFFLADENIVLGGFRIAFEGDGRNRMVRSFCRQAGEADSVLVLPKIYFFT